MASPICEERFDLASPKRQKIEANTCDDYDSESPESLKIKPKTFDDYDECTPEEIQQFDDEWEKSQGFEMDFSKLTYWSVYQPVDLDANTWADEAETDGEFIALLANAALTKRNADRGTSLKLGKILMANYHTAAGLAFYISFEVNDPSASDGNQTIPFRAEVGYLGLDLLSIYSCEPKPSP